jgi:hypothetical protein
MQLSFGFGPGEGPDARNSLVSKLAAVLAAARRTSVYGPLLARAPVESPEAQLAQLPPAGIHTYLENREQFRNPKASVKARSPDGRVDNAICGPLEDLLRLAERVGMGKAARPATARSLHIRTPLGERLASERARDCLWRAFELPVFEELAGSEGEVFAAECEAHSGFHLDTGSALFEACYGELVVTSLVALRYPILRLRTGWVGAIDRGACPCGERVSRFVPVAMAALTARKPPAAARTLRRVGDPAVAAV